MQRLSPQDASFLHIEDAVSHMHIGSVAIFEGPPPGYDALARMIGAHLPSVPATGRRSISCRPRSAGRRGASRPEALVGFSASPLA
jgi:diacylglycerol O-acyltransferase / wax synthase